MAWLEGHHDGRRIVVPVAILDSRNLSDLTHVSGKALIDTGATISAIAPRIIAELGLVSIGKRLMGVATEERIVHRYLFRVGFFEERPDRGTTKGFPFVLAECDGFAIQPSGHFDVILGMDVLAQCDFELSRTGRWKIGYG